MALDLSKYLNVTAAGRNSGQTFNLGNLWIDQEGGYSRDSDGQRYWDPEGTAIQSSYYLGGAPGAGEKLMRLDELPQEVRDTYLNNVRAGGGQVYDLNGMQFITEESALPTWQGYGGGADAVNQFLGDYSVPILMALTGAAAGGAFGDLGTGEFAGMGTFGSPATSVTPTATNPAAPNIDYFAGTQPPPDSYWNMVADAGGTVTDAGAVNAGTVGTELGANVTANSVSPLIDSIAPAVDVTAPAFGSTLGSVGTLPGIGAAVTIPGVTTNLANSAELIAGAGGGGTGLLSTIANGVNGALGTTLTANDVLKMGGNVLGSIGTGVLGNMGADKMADALSGIYQQTRSDRMPALGAFNNALSNPDTFYNSAPATGALDAVLRKLSVNGNPIGNPGDLAKAAAYNLGGYNDYLRTLSGPAFGTTGTEVNVATGAANADAGGYNATGYALGRALNPTPNLQDLLGGLGGLRLSIGGMNYGR